MKNRLLLTCTALLLACSPALRAAEAMAPKAEEKTTELGEQMSKINKAFNALRKKEQIGDATKNDASLALIATINAGLQASLKLKPETTAEKPAAEQAAYVEKYQAEMKKMIELVGKVEAALKAGNNEQATALIAEVQTQQRADHKDFRKQKPAAPAAK